MSKSNFPELKKAVDILGGCEATGLVCRVSGKAVQKWLKAGRLPRTEATGETNYAETIAATDKRINKDALLASLMRAKSV